MKRAIKAFVAAFFAAFMCIFGGINAFAWDHDETWLRVHINGAPEGTAYVDLLLKDTKNDSTAVDYNDEAAARTIERNEKNISFGRECGLAKYNEDGYTSMLLRHNFVEESSFGHYTLKTETHRIFNKRRCVKLAYCDKDGNVIKVTNEVKVGYANLKTPVMYYFETDGDTLTFNFAGAAWSKLHPWIDTLVIIVPIAFLLLCFVLVRKMIRKSKAKQINADSQAN